jgi:hypothetical protein
MVLGFCFLQAPFFLGDDMLLLRILIPKLDIYLGCVGVILCLLWAIITHDLGYIISHLFELFFKELLRFINIG